MRKVCLHVYAQVVACKHGMLGRSYSPLAKMPLLIFSTVTETKRCGNLHASSVSLTRPTITPFLCNFVQTGRRWHMFYFYSDIEQMLPSSVDWRLHRMPNRSACKESDRKNRRELWLPGDRASRGEIFLMHRRQIVEYPCLARRSEHYSLWIGVLSQKNCSTVFFLLLLR